MEENDFIIDDSVDELVPVEKVAPKQVKQTRRKEVKVSEKDAINCLRNEKIFVKYIINDRDGITDKSHPYYGGMADGSIYGFTVPVLTNGNFKNVLTDSEKSFLEDYMGLDYNALSVYNRGENNYWANYLIKIDKNGLILDLSVPNQYIDYKVLLANVDEVCPSPKVLKERPKATYKFVLVSSNETYSITKDRVNNNMQSYKEFGKIEDDYDILKCIIETIDGRTVSSNSSLDFLKSRIIEIIDTNAKRFLDVVKDPLLPFRVFINKAVTARVIAKRGDYYYYNDMPLCLDGENPTISYAAKYLSLPKNQELKLSIEAKMK